MAQGAIPKGRGFEPHSCQFSAIRAQLSSRRFCLSLRREETLLGLVRFSCFENLLCQVEFYPRRRNQWGVSFRSPVWATLATTICVSSGCDMTVWPSGLRRWLQAPVRKGVGSNPTAVTFSVAVSYRHTPRAATCSWETPRPPPSWETPSAIWASQSCAGACRQGTDPICLLPNNQDSLAEWSKALASGASPQGRGFGPHSCHIRALACCA